MGLGLGAVGFLGAGLAACGGGDDDGGNVGTAEGALGFTAIAANSGDAITVPTGYSHAVFCRWGDPLFANSPPGRPMRATPRPTRRCSSATTTTGCTSSR